jgi:hypothetical protein
VTAPANNKPKKNGQSKQGLDEVQVIVFICAIGLVGLACCGWWPERVPRAPVLAQTPENILTKQVLTKALPGLKVPLPSPEMAPKKSSMLAQQEAYLRLIQQTYAALPRRHVPGSSGSAHETPDHLLQVSGPLAQIKQEWQKNLELKPEALHFYQKCAADFTLMQALRAVCWEDALSLGAAEYVAAQIPSPVKELAKKLSSQED